MKVRISLTIDIDPAAWTDTYGVEGAQAIREDVQLFGVNVLLDALHEMRGDNPQY